MKRDETSMIQLSQTLMKIHHASSIRPIKNKLFSDETSMIQLSQTLMKIHHASSIRPIKNKLFSDEISEQSILIYSYLATKYRIIRA
jgi:hypothetical protein